MPLTAEQRLERLDQELARQKKPLLKLDAYYEGMQPLNFVAPELFAELNSSVVDLVINWPELGVEAYETRLDVEGFRFPGEPDADERLWEIWQDNDMDEMSQQAHLEALVMGRSYAIVGVGEDEETPLITVEHPLQVTASRDPATRAVTNALKRWKDEDGQEWRTLYLPGENRFYVREKGKLVEDDSLRTPNFGIPPVVPLLNRGRMLKHQGRSEFQSIIGIADAANKMATDMMISAEFHAMPRRWVFGMDEDDFVDENGKALTTWQQIAGRLWATDKGPDQVKAGQFEEADLSNFHNSIKLLAQLGSQLLALPPHYMSFNSDNPASADAIRSSEAQLVKRCERKQTVFGASWKRIMTLALQYARVDQDIISKARRLETVWGDPATPTQAQKSDAVQKLSGGVPILPREGAWDELRYSKARKDRLRKQFAEQDKANPMAQIARGLADRDPAGDGRG